MKVLADLENGGRSVVSIDIQVLTDLKKRLFHPSTPVGGTSRSRTQLSPSVVCDRLSSNSSGSGDPELQEGALAVCTLTKNTTFAKIKLVLKIFRGNLTFFAIFSQKTCKKTEIR